ncbi:MAG: alpha/beta hydrolase [Cyanobacteria bacterium J06581_3]
MTEQPPKGKYLLSVVKIPPPLVPVPFDFPAYFVGNTAPHNVEDDNIGNVEDPRAEIDNIANFLSQKDNPEILIVIHGYNTPLGSFQTKESPAAGTQGWYQDIRDHIAKNCDRKPDGLLLLGYRWPSEQINGGGQDSLSIKLRNALQSLPAAFKTIVIVALAILLATVTAIITDGGSLSPGIEFVVLVLTIVAVFSISLVITLFLLRIVGYFRDAYRARNFGVPDLVELIRQIDKAVSINTHWRKGRRIKLSFIGHSMGGFVVTNTVRILSDVFAPSAIGNLDAEDKAKVPSPNIGHVFSLGRLVLVSPDIPAEAIISSRTNFLSSSIRRFEETYLFSNEGDMALKLASTAANYASFPARTLEGGYRLGNVVVRSPLSSFPSGSSQPTKPQYGIINFDANADEGEQMIDMKPRQECGGVEPTQIACTTRKEKMINVSSFLDYLYMLKDKSLSERQCDMLEPGQKPIAELFTVFDCTDYSEFLQRKGEKPQKVSLLTYGLGKRSLQFFNYARLILAMITGKIDNHGGYFYSGEPEGKQQQKPEAYVTKQLIYGLACLGFRPFLASLSNESLMCESLTVTQQELQALSQLCESRNIQVLLAAERYNRDVLGIINEHDRDGY